MSYTPPSGRASRVSSGGLFGSPSMPFGTAQSRMVDPFAKGMFASQPGMPQMPQGPQMPPMMPPGNPGMPAMPAGGPQGGPAQPAAGPNMGLPVSTNGTFTGADQVYGHPILIPSITALMTGIATSRPPSPDMMWDTSKGQWTSNLSAYTGK